MACIASGLVQMLLIVHLYETGRIFRLVIFKSNIKIENTEKSTQQVNHHLWKRGRVLDLKF